MNDVGLTGKIAFKILTWICDPTYIDEIKGDLMEAYHENERNSGRRAANYAFLIETMKFIFRSLSEKLTFKGKVTNVMWFPRIPGSFKEMVRRSRKSISYTIINLFSLAIGFACVILIMLYTLFELSYDQYDEAHSIYRLSVKTERENGSISENAMSPAPWGPAMLKDFPEVKNFCRFMHYRLDMVLRNPETDVSFYENKFFWADSSVFNMFPVTLIKGDAATALTRPNTVVITQEVAMKYFGNADVIGKVLHYQNYKDLEITGVIEEIPENSHFDADLLASFITIEQEIGFVSDPRTIYFYSYFELQPGTDTNQLVLKFPEFIRQISGEDFEKRVTAELMPVGDIHLHSNKSNEIKNNGSARLVSTLNGIVIFLLIISIANFVNLSSAKSLARAREVGVRKINGASRFQLIMQFLIETIWLAVTALIIGAFVAQLLLPLFNQITERNLSFLVNPDFYFIGYLLLISIGIGLLAGFYPAVYISTFKPTNVLKNKVTESGINRIISKSLIFLQFAICTILIGASLVIFNQLSFMIYQDPGYKTKQVMMINFTGGEFDISKVPAIKDQLSTIPGVESISLTSHAPSGDQPYGTRYRFAGIPLEENEIIMNRMTIDHDFLETYNIQLAAGRSFNVLNPADSNAFMINQKAVEELNLDNPEDALGITISYTTWGFNGPYVRTGSVIGVINNFHFRSLHHPIDAMVFDVQLARYHYFGIKISNQGTHQIISELQETWKALLPGVPFRYEFLDDRYKAQYENESNVAQITAGFTIISILIACIGLIGLVTFYTQQKFKEIGIRKVIGASVSQILLLIGSKFLKIQMLAVLFALPLSYYLVTIWLEGFAYRIPFPIEAYLLTILLIFLVSILAVSYHSLKAALINPVDALKDD